MSNKRSIPEVRKRLYELADIHNLPELKELADETIRRSPVRRGEHTSKRVTKELRKSVKIFAAQHPDMHLGDIGNVFGINQGRVSEILHGG